VITKIDTLRKEYNNKVTAFDSLEKEITLLKNKKQNDTTPVKN
jgi:hypothetical protein